MQLKDTENFTENSKAILGIHSLKNKEMHQLMKEGMARGQMVWKAK